MLVQVLVQKFADNYEMASEFEAIDQQNKAVTLFWHVSFDFFEKLCLDLGVTDVEGSVFRDFDSYGFVILHIYTP